MKADTNIGMNFVQRYFEILPPFILNSGFPSGAKFTKLSPIINNFGALNTNPSNNSKIYESESFSELSHSSIFTEHSEILAMPNTEKKGIIKWR